MPDPVAALPRALGDPPVRGRYRVEPEDFQVHEQLGFAPSGAGEHVLLRVVKRDLDTERVARALARHAGVRASAVGYAGLKDRRAVAEQWFSVQLPGREAPDWDGLELPGVEVLEQHRHDRKLRRGALAGNRFRLVLRSLEGDPGELQQRWQRILSRGVPNYFGPQRFGRDGANLDRALALFAGDRRGDRHRRGLYLSAARALVFNQVLARRVEQDSWDRLLPGELAMLDGSRSVFAVPEPTPELEARRAAGDIHPSGPLWGRGGIAPGGAALALERAVAAWLEEWCRGLEAAGLDSARRALRVCPGNPEFEARQGIAVLAFTLPPGSYATTVLRELISEP